jgi:tetratricopeptide (TPR) repeat protein
MLATGSSADTALMSVYRTTPSEFAADAFARVTHPNPATSVALPGATAAAIRVEPANGAALLAGLRGDIAFGRGDRTEALAQWKAAIDLGTDDSGICYRYAALTDDRAALERTLALNPGFDDARYKLAILEKAGGHMEAAVENLRKMKPPEGERAFHYWTALGDALLDLGRRAEAKQAAAQAAMAAKSGEERKRAANLDWMASTELAVEFDGKQAHTVRVPIETAPARNPFIESGDKAKSVAATLEQVDCGDDGIKVKLMAAGALLVLSVPDPSRVQIRNAGGIAFEFTCGPQQGRKVLVEYTAGGVLRGLELH